METSRSLATPHPLWSPGFWRAYWITTRPYLLFVSGVSGWVGLAIAGELPAHVFIPAFVAFFFAYGLGQALTDVFQTDTDSISSPYRPLTRGLITPAQVLGVSLAGLAGCAFVFLLCNPWTLLPSLAGVAGLASYTHFKRRWWGGPFWNSWIVALLPLIGVLCAPGSRTDLASALSKPALVPAMASLFFSYAIFVLLGYFKDISADRATGYETLPVVAGWRASVLVSAIYCALAIVASLELLRRSGLEPSLSAPGAWTALSAWILGAVFLVLAHATMARARSEAEAFGPIAHSVRGFVLLHLGEALALRPSLWILGLAFYAAFEVVLATRPEKTQI